MKTYFPQKVTDLWLLSMVAHLYLYKLVPLADKYFACFEMSTQCQEELQDHLKGPDKI